MQLSELEHHECGRHMVNQDLINTQAVYQVNSIQWTAWLRKQKLATCNRTSHDVRKCTTEAPRVVTPAVDRPVNSLKAMAC